MEGTDAMAALGGTDIRKVMKSQGPIVTAVILRCPPSSPALDEDEDGDSKPAAVVDSKAEPAPENSGSSETETENGDTTDASAPTPRVILSDLIEELQIDTTPSKSKVAEVLGGPFTFLGQFEDEGIVLMVRNFPDDLESDLRDIYENSEEEHHHENENNNNNNNNASSFSFSEQLSKNFNIKALKAVCFQRDIDTGAMTEKRELVEALVDYQKRLPPHNPHRLQPPLHKARVRGDILVMKVAETAEELDHDSSETDNQKTHADDGESKTSDSNDTGGDAGEQKENPSQSNSDAPNNNNNNDDDNAKEAITMPSNDEFFLDYSKEAYIEFASRTDIPEHEIELEECDEEDGEETEAETETRESGEESAAMVGVDEGDNNDDDDDDDDDDEDDEDDDPEEIDENDKSAMFNLVMNELLRQYREENGRGPNTKELLELRSNIARELGVAIAHEIDGDWDKMAKENQVPSAKKIYFTKEADRVREYVPDANEYPSDRGEEDDEDYDEDDDDEEEDDNEEYSEDISRPLHDAYDEAEDGEHTDQPPRKRLKVSEDETDEGDSKPPAAAAAAAAST